MRLNGSGHYILAVLIGLLAEHFLLRSFGIHPSDLGAWNSFAEAGLFAVFYFGVVYVPRFWVKRNRTED